MRRLLMAAIVAAMCLPAGASAAVIRDTRYHIGGLCTGGDLTAAFGSGSKINRITVTTSTATGNTGDLTATVRGRTATFTATMPMIGNDGTALGTGTLTATMTFVGDRLVFTPTPDNLIHGYAQPLAGSGSFTWNGETISLDCTGEVRGTTVILN